MSRLLTAVFLLLICVAAEGGKVEAYAFDSAADEARYKQLVAELRCLVCQNQNLQDSNAELAQDMRRQTYEMVSAGKSNEQIVTYMVDRYGDFVLYRPPLKSSTFLLWVGPFILLLIGLGALLWVVLRIKRTPEPELTTEQHERARQLLEQDEDKNP